MASCILLAAVAGSIHAGDFNVVRIAANNWAFCRKTELNNAGFTLDRRQGSQAIWKANLLRRSGFRAVAFLIKNCKGVAGKDEHISAREAWVREAAQAKLAVARALVRLNFTIYVQCLWVYQNF